MDLDKWTCFVDRAPVNSVSKLFALFAGGVSEASTGGCKTTLQPLSLKAKDPGTGSILAEEE
jgi:hypothetical protein